VLTPHPLEAARLLGRTTIDVQADRLASAASLARALRLRRRAEGIRHGDRAPAQVPAINPTGNARLATGAPATCWRDGSLRRLAQGSPPFEAAQAAVFRHGLLADGWPADHPMTAAALAARASG
jgi:NAD(P)H-hydrate repair Nnr-like enzyme with NAD(P)H-hydrate dehydratase domain